MKIPVLEKRLAKVHKNADGMQFPEIILACRKALGLNLLRASEFIGISRNRLAIMEKSHFLFWPRATEFRDISKLYGLQDQFLRKKAQEFLQGKIPQKGRWL